MVPSRWRRHAGETSGCSRCASGTKNTANRESTASAGNLLIIASTNSNTCTGYVNQTARPLVVKYSTCERNHLPPGY